MSGVLKLPLPDVNTAQQNYEGEFRDFIINPESILIYMGAIDDVPSRDPEDMPDSVNYVRETPDATLGREEIEVQQTRPCGCSGKYAD